MHFIFPTNYNFKNKLFGFFDYSTIFTLFSPTEKRGFSAARFYGKIFWEDFYL